MLTHIETNSPYALKEVSVCQMEHLRMGIKLLQQHQSPYPTQIGCIIGFKAQRAPVMDDSYSFELEEVQ
jgi:hypothetical protein